METFRADRQRFRVWITTYDDWSPACWNELPPRAVALEPVDEDLFSVTEAALFVESFNRSILECGKPIWAVAVPVVLRLEGDACRGMPVTGHAFQDQDMLTRSDPARGANAP